jgi:hypothetical protein
MGVSITRIVKFIRKGKGVIVAQSRSVYNYTYKEWTQLYGLSGRLVDWDGIINVSDFSVGDTMVINGTVSDKQRITISLYAKVTAIDTNQAIITAQSLYYIASGENGEDGNDGIDAITIDISPENILHKKTDANTSYAVTIKVFEGTKQLISSNGSGSSFKCNVDTSNFPTGLKGNTVVGTNVYTLILVVEANSNPSKDIEISIVCRGVTHKRTVSFKTVADGQPGAKGDRGPALRGPQAWSDCAVGYMFQSGASGEEYKDVVLYGGNYYSCIKSHTKTASNNPGGATDTNSGLWKLADKFEMVATKILLAQYALVKNLGVEAIDMKDANGNIIFQAKDGNVTCNSGTFTNGTFTNVKVIGSIRNPFNLANDSFDVDYSDNVAMLSSGGAWLDAYSMPWDVSQNGRRLSIVNYKWGSTMAQGQAAISAPGGKYFFEDGIQKSKLKVSREIVEMIGYGTATEFYGWIVLNRIDLMTSQKYGHCLKALAFGTVSGGDRSSNTSITSNTFDGSKLTVSRQSEGLYRVSFPSTWFTYASNCRVILTGRGVCYGASSPVKATMHSLGNGYFDVAVSDDASRNDGSFDFIIYNGSDFDVLK